MGVGAVVAASVGIELIADEAKPDTVEVTVENTLPATDKAVIGLLCLSLSACLSVEPCFAFCFASYSALIFAISSGLTLSGNRSAALDVEAEEGSESLVAK